LGGRKGEGEGGSCSWSYGKGEGGGKSEGEGRSCRVARGGALGLFEHVEWHEGWGAATWAAGGR